MGHNAFGHLKLVNLDNRDRKIKLGSMALFSKVEVNFVL